MRVVFFSGLGVCLVYRRDLINVYWISGFFRNGEEFFRLLGLVGFFYSFRVIFREIIVFIL